MSWEADGAGRPATRGDGNGKVENRVVRINVRKLRHDVRRAAVDRKIGVILSKERRRLEKLDCVLWLTYKTMCQTGLARLLAFPIGIVIAFVPVVLLVQRLEIAKIITSTFRHRFDMIYLPTILSRLPIIISLH